ncbi:hypothetical protein [Nocardia sp. NPDC052566]|uniref:hypothetical protein n=1 Tax=Nocardia sp. NPDC052566 TaxID=3364330 RepID=UPI0037CBA09E
MSLDDVAADLYGLEPGEFVTARAAMAGAAQEAGDRELAAAIAKLRRPTVTAWVVNVLARAEPEEVDALLRLGAALRAAQRELSGDRLRELTTQRQQVVNALAKRAGALAADRGKPVSETVLREVAQTLTAALADPEVAERVHTGTLATAATYAGFGPAGPDLVAVPETAAPSKADGKPKTGAPREDPRQELDDALAALESARAALDSAQAEATKATERLAEVDTRLGALRAELEHAEQERQFARTGERTAKELVHTSQRQLDRVERRVQRARDRVNDA